MRRTLLSHGARALGLQRFGQPTLFNVVRHLTAGERSKEVVMEEKIREGLAPEVVQIEDTSGGCGAFYRILVVSDAFKGKGVVAQHRLVQGLLSEDIKDIHGLQLVTSTPEKFKKKLK